MQELCIETIPNGMWKGYNPNYNLQAYLHKPYVWVDWIRCFYTPDVLMRAVLANHHRQFEDILLDIYGYRRVLVCTRTQSRGHQLLRGVLTEHHLEGVDAARDALQAPALHQQVDLLLDLAAARSTTSSTTSVARTSAMRMRRQTRTIVAGATTTNAAGEPFLSAAIVRITPQQRADEASGALEP